MENLFQFRKKARRIREKSKHGHALKGVGIFAYFLILSAQAFAFPAQVANAPTNNLELTLLAIKSAQKSLLVNSYELTEPRIANAIEDRINSGVVVQILQEGQPVGGFPDASRQIQDQLVSAMNRAENAENKYFKMTKGADARKRRYRFDHAKYMVVDGESLLIASENYSATGNPSPGTQGNRGWEVFLHDPETAGTFAGIFSQDTDTSYGDVELIRESDSSSGCWFPIICMNFLTSQKQGSDTDSPAQNPVNLNTVEILTLRKITSPESSLSGLLNMIESARSTLDIQEMTFYSTWTEPKTQSPLINALIAAAARGVQVRVLLNDETAFIQPKQPNERWFPIAPPSDNLTVQARVNHNLNTVNLLNQIARSRGLSLTARIANLSAMGVKIIHNKGALVDHDKTLVSSINWNSNSILNNREAGVLMTSPEANAYFKALFEKDWQASETSRTP